MFGSKERDEREEPRREAPQEQPKEQDDKPVVASDDDEDWGAVPAFLRRSKLK
jgi:hypothetical protein